MKKRFVFLFVMFASNLVNAQWFQQVSGTTANLNSVYFINDSTGFAVGDSGVILKTNNGGLNWLSLNIGTSIYLYSVFFTDQNTGYTAGPSLFKTTDAGTTWSANEKISALFDPHVGYPSQDKMGDYFDMISDNTGAHLAWANTLTGGQDAYYTHIIPNISVDVKKTIAANAFSIYPNPSDGVVELKGAPKNFKLELYSTLGEKVFSQFYASAKKIDLNFLDRGIYLLKLTTAENNFEVKKLIIK